jgi:hypothetical protein
MAAELISCSAQRQSNTDADIDDGDDNNVGHDSIQTINLIQLYLINSQKLFYFWMPSLKWFTIVGEMFISGTI